VRANPDPDKGVRTQEVARRAVMVAEADRPQVTFELLEAERGIERVFQPERESVAGQLLNLRRQGVKPPPERPEASAGNMTSQTAERTSPKNPSHTFFQISCPILA